MNAPTTLPLALPPPRRVLLLSADALALATQIGGFDWQSYYEQLCRAQAYETTLQPSEKDLARWTALRRLAFYAEGILKHRSRAA